MALVSCRECKKEVSDQAKVCPHCGIEEPFRDPSLATQVCRACGKVVTPEADGCPHCGIKDPFEEEEQNPFILFFKKLNKPLINCRACKQPVGRSAFWCVHCGTLFPNSWTIRIAIFLFFLFILVFYLAIVKGS